MSGRGLIALSFVAIALAGCESTAKVYVWNLPDGTPQPIVPEDNPMTDDKVALGRYLFYDKRLSGNGTMSCGSCHQQSLAFTDGKATPQGSTGVTLARNSMSLANIAYNEHSNWANPIIAMLEAQMLVPMFGDSPIELGMSDQLTTIFDRLRADAVYRELFPRAFPANRDPFTVENMVQSIACFERTILSFNAPYDRFDAGVPGAISESAVRGRAAFFQEKLDCYHCHQTPTFSSGFISVHNPPGGGEFRNNAIYNLDGKGAYPANNTGLYAFTGFSTDMGKFRAPTLRNIALTAPYFHDGSAATLDDVIDHYAHGGRVIAGGPNAGDGSQNPNRDPLVKGFTLSQQERDDLKAFLETLTDDDFLREPSLSDPFQ